MSQKRWVDVFNAAGLPALLEPDMPLWLRCHVPLCRLRKRIGGG
jgi:2-dehydropantoate 2-reductase